MQTSQVHVGALTLTADPLSQFSTINTVGNPLDLAPLDLARGGSRYLRPDGQAPQRRHVPWNASQTSANVTLIAGSQDAVLVSGAGVDTLVGGTGDDTFYLY
jgi:hypothetical protein